MKDLFLYNTSVFFSFVFLCCVFGFITKAINEHKGYDGGFFWGFGFGFIGVIISWFWWGFFFGYLGAIILGLIGIIVIVVKPDNHCYYEYSFEDHNKQLINNENRKIIEQGGWKCSNCRTINANYVGTCSCGKTKEENDKMKRRK